MKENSISKPILQSGWLRALLFGILILISPLIIKRFFVTGINAPVIAAVFFLLVVITTAIFRLFIDRKSFISLGFELKGNLSDAIAGGMLAIFIVGTCSLILKLTGHLKWMDIILDSRALFIVFGTIVLIALYEEIIFRGYILSNLLDSFLRWPALLISALAFMLFHWTSDGFFPLINTFIAGLIMGLNYTYNRNLWFPICFHVGWKFMEGPILGFPEYGSPQTLLQTNLQGNENATGGNYGLDGSFILTVVALFSLLLLNLFLQKKFSPVSPPVPGQI
jgi:uncharacterized protein